MDAIRQKSEDLRDELQELERWEEKVNKEAAAKKARKVPVSPAAMGYPEPPPRGSVPSIKQALADEAKKTGSQSNPAHNPAEVEKEKGNKYYAEGKVKEAIEAYGAGIDFDPNSNTAAILYSNRSMCYIKLGEWEKAEKDASMSLQLNSGYAKAYYRRAVARKNLGRLKEAKTDLESVLALCPNDASANQELEVVKKLLQAERVNATAKTAPKKKIVIQEIEDEDDEEDDEKKGSTPAPQQPQSTGADQRQSRINMELKEVEQARKAEEEQRRSEALSAEVRLDARRKKNPAVEIIEDDEEVAEVADKAAEAKKEAPAKPDAVRHADPAAPTEKKPSPESSSSKDTSPTSDVAKASKIPTPAAAVRVRCLPAAESLKQPRTFFEFERDYSLVEKDESLRTSYIRLLNPSTLSSLFGSNMTPEILSGILRSVKAMPAKDALEFMKGLNKINRVGELALFFDDDEEQVVEDVAKLIRSGGASDEEVKALTKAFKSL